MTLSDLGHLHRGVRPEGKARTARGTCGQMRRGPCVTEHSLVTLCGAETGGQSRPKEISAVSSHGPAEGASAHCRA